jgi:DNA-binding MarR family transcriptional regulator
LAQADFLFLERTTGLTRGNLSSHLARLEAAGYVTVEKTYRGRVPLTLLALSPQGRQAFDEYRQKLRSIAANLPD